MGTFWRGKRILRGRWARRRRLEFRDGPQPATAEPGDPHRRDHLPSGAGTPHGQSRMPARPRPGTRPRSMAFQAVDLLRAAVEGRTPRPDAAGTMDGVVLPR